MVIRAKFHSHALTLQSEIYVGDTIKDPAPHPTRRADAGDLSEQGISSDEQVGNISDHDPLAADPEPPAADTCPLNSRLTARQMTSGTYPFSQTLKRFIERIQSLLSLKPCAC
jgi:hypothetical protein